MFENILSPFSRIKVETWEVSDKEYPTKIVEAMKDIGVELKTVHATIPFPKMKESDKRVWELYCPAHEKLEDITVPLPMKVVELIKEYKDTFDSFEVWSEARDQVDPVLIGNLKKGKESFQYLICRWGEALKPFSEIRQAMMQQWKQHRIAKLQEKLSLVETDTIKHFEGGWVHDWIN